MEYHQTDSAYAKELKRRLITAVDKEEGFLKVVEKFRSSSRYAAQLLACFRILPLPDRFLFSPLAVVS
jgi:hypothetical protein